MIDDLSLITVHNFENVFDLNGGSGTTPPNQIVLAATFDDAGQMIPANPVREGYDFVGWNSAADGTGTTLSSTQVLGTAASTLTWYAIWAEPGPPPGPAPTPGPADGTLPTTGGDPATTKQLSGVAMLLLMAGAVAITLALTRPTLHGHRTQRQRG